MQIDFQDLARGHRPFAAFVPTRIIKHTTKCVLTLTLLTALTSCDLGPRWREVRAANVGLEFALPCAPEQRSRELPLLANAQAVPVHMTGCNQAGVTYALAYAELPPGEDAAAVAARWQTGLTAPKNPGLWLRPMLHGQVVVMLSMQQDPLPSVTDASLKQATSGATDLAVSTIGARFIESVRLLVPLK